MFYNCFTNTNYGYSNYGFGNFYSQNFNMNNFYPSFFLGVLSFFQPRMLDYNKNFYINNNYSLSENRESIFLQNEIKYQPISLASLFSDTLDFSQRTQSDLSSVRLNPVNQDKVITQSTSSVTSTRTESRRKTSRTVTTSLSQYDSEKGNRLAEIAMRNAGFVINPSTKQVTSNTKDPQKFTGKCARYVQTSISDAGLGDNISRVGSAYLMADSLRRNSNFSEISASTSLSDLPPGAVIVYNRGAQGYSSEHGHVEIITKDGRAVSDAITDNLYKRPSHIFIPV